MTDRLDTASYASAEEFPENWYAIAADGHFWFEWRRVVLLKQLQALRLPLTSHWRGLDIGCGHGLVQRQLERVSAWRIDGADLNREALRLNEGTRGESFYYDIHDRRPDLEARYDFLVLLDIIEHIPESQAFLTSSLFHLKPGGWLLVNVPANPGLLSYYDEVVGHVRRYSKRSMRTELEGAGLDVCDMRYWGLSMLPMLLLRKLLMSRDADAGEILEQGLNPPRPWMNGPIKGIMSLETRLFCSPPLGTSLLAVARKPATS